MLRMPLAVHAWSVHLVFAIAACSSAVSEPSLGIVSATEPGSDAAAGGTTNTGNGGAYDASIRAEAAAGAGGSASSSGGGSGGADSGAVRDASEPDSEDGQPVACAALLCMPGTLSGLDCPTILSSCGSACQGYVVCVAKCDSADVYMSCVDGCSHRVYYDDAGSPQTASVGTQYLACACCDAVGDR